jgi:hypothetical protein
VFCGFLVGVCSGCLWYKTCVMFIFPRLAGLAASPLGRWLRLRECYDVDDVVEFEWRAYKAPRMKRESMISMPGGESATSRVKGN